MVKISRLGCTKLFLSYCFFSLTVTLEVITCVLQKRKRKTKVTQINGDPNCLKSPNLPITALCTKLSKPWAGLSVFTFSKDRGLHISITVIKFPNQEEQPTQPSVLGGRVQAGSETGREANKPAFPGVLQGPPPPSPGGLLPSLQADFRTETSCPGKNPQWFPSSGQQIRRTKGSGRLKQAVLCWPCMYIYVTYCPASKNSFSINFSLSP